MSPDERADAPDPGEASPELPKASSRRARTDAAPPSFEAAFGQLQSIVERLEAGSVDVETALSLFERGSALARDCERIIDQAELRVTRLAAESASPLSEATS